MVEHVYILSIVASWGGAVIDISISHVAKDGY
jgi:hypothetical protein